MIFQKYFKITLMECFFDWTTYILLVFNHITSRQKLIVFIHRKSIAKFYSGFQNEFKFFDLAEIAAKVNQDLYSSHFRSSFLSLSIAGCIYETDTRIRLSPLQKRDLSVIMRGISSMGFSEALNTGRPESQIDRNLKHERRQTEKD